MTIVISFFHQGYGPAHCGFRRHVPDRGPVGPAAEAAVGDEGSFFAQTHTDESGCGGEHFLHTRAALGSFVANHDHISGPDNPIENRCCRVGLALKYACPAGPLEHLGSDRGLLDDGAFRGQVAIQNGDSALTMIGLLKGANDIAIKNGESLEVFAHRSYP